MADGDSLFSIASRRFFKDPAAIAGMGGVLLLLLPALYAPFIANGRPLLMVGQGVASSHRDLVERMSDPNQETIPASIIHQACYYHKDHLQVLSYWMAERGYDKVVKRLKHVEEKFKQNKGAWLRGPQIVRGLIPAYVSDQILFLIHPREQRYLTFREGLSIMGMPKDFNLIGNLRQNRNHIGQNVCVDTAKVFVKEIKKFLEHKNKNNYNINNGYIIQDHIKDDKIEIRKD